MADLRIVDAPLLSTVKGTEKLPTGGEGNFSVSVNQVADFAKLKWVLATEGYVDNAVGNVQANLNLHKNNESNPHNVTKTQVGLGNVDNTADLDKPVSNATQSAIITANSGKADKSYVDSQDQLKADKVSVESSLSLKADKTELIASKIMSYGNQNQQLINDFGGAKWYAKSGGYELWSTVKLSNGDTVKSTEQNNIVNPNVDMTGWVKTNSAGQIFDASGKSQQEVNNSTALELVELPKKIGKNKPLYKNKLIIFCGDSTTEQGQVANRGGLYDRLLNFYALNGGVLNGLRGVVNYGMSGYTLSAFVNGAENANFIGATATNPNWDYTGVKTWGVWGGVTLADAVKTAGDIYVLCYGINDLILTDTGKGTQDQCQDYITNLISQAVEKISTALPSAQIILRPPNPMTSRPYNQTGFPSQSVYTTFGTDLAADSALVNKWNNALYYAYYEVAQKYKSVDFLDTWNMVAYNWDANTVPANKNPYSHDLVHPNNAGYTAIADGIAMLLAGKTSGYSQPRATQAEGMVPYFGNTPLYYYGRYPEGSYYTKLLENYGTVTESYIEVAIPLSTFKGIIGTRTSLTFCIGSTKFKSRLISFTQDNLTDPTGLGKTTRIGGLTIGADPQGSGSISFYDDKRIAPSFSLSSGTINVVVSAGTGSGTFTLPTQGTYFATLNARSGDYNHARLGTYLITFDNASTNDFMSTQLVGVQISKGGVAPTSLGCSVDQLGVVTVTIGASNTTWTVDFSFYQIMKK